MHDAAEAILVPAAGFGGRLLQARLEIELTRKQLAGKLGVHARTVRRWERDQSVPREANLYLMAKVLEVRPLWLLDGVGPIEPKVR